MTLSIAEQNKLRQEFHTLSHFFAGDERKLSSLQECQEEIIQFCFHNDIPLYNICSLKLIDAFNLLNRLITLFPSRDATNADLDRQRLAWKEAFEEHLARTNREIVDLHQRSYLSIGDQYQKTAKVSLTSLLTINDMRDLLVEPRYESEQILKSRPFSLTECSSDQEEDIKKLIKQADEESKTIFLPVIHDGHWFYLLMEDGEWSIHDSKPLDRGSYSWRQKAIWQKSLEFLRRIVGDETISFDFSTSSKANDHDCGTQVVNAYRKKADENYHEKDHVEILKECLAKQVPEAVLPEDDNECFSDDTTERVIEHLTENVIVTTSSTQRDSEKFVLYKENITQLIEKVQNQGFFAEVSNKINLAEIDSAKADSGESDEEFAKRLQEAEFRKVGLGTCTK
jgi:hypothetical protein